MEQEKKRNPFGGMRRASRAVSDFLRAGRRNEAGRKPSGDGESVYELADRLRGMSDEEFDAAVKGGSLTPDQIRKASEYDWDVYMGDVWSEGANADAMPEPTFDEFMADPARYGYERGINAETDRTFDRYAKYGRRK